MSNIAELANLPDLSFIDNKTLQDVRNEMVRDYLSKLGEMGEKAELGEAHPDRLIMYAAAPQIYQAMQMIEKAAKQNFLKYSVGEYLDNLAAYKKIERLKPQCAVTDLKFTLSGAQPSVVTIPGGTRVKTDSNTYFVTDNYVEIPAGQMSVTVTATAYDGGSASNGVAVGEIKTIVDPIGYVASVTNITVSRGGSDEETDDELTLRVYNAPASWSVAGPKQAYEYWAKQSRADIEDVICYSPSATKVIVVFMLEGGVLPNSSDITAMETYLRDNNIRPLADEVTAQAPAEVNYTIDVKYFINKSDEGSVSTIQSAVNKALNEYVAWQRKIGRDVNPSKIYQYLMQAGAKRIEVTAPAPISVSEYAIPKASTVTLTYGGIEDD